MASNEAEPSAASTPTEAASAQSLDTGAAAVDAASSNPDSSSATTTAPLSSTGNARLSHTTACLPLVYGSVAFYLGKKADEFHTHKWTLFLRGPNHEDLSLCIQKVIFQLHPSFAQPVRELTHPPFEVTETGWGEFEAQIRILWKDSSEKATVFTHGIKLYPPGSTASAAQATKEPVVAEKYDEVVFTDPHESFYRQLMRISIVPKIHSQDAMVQASFSGYSDVDDFNKLVEAQTFLTKELVKVKERLRIVTQETEQVDGALLNLQESKRAAGPARGGVRTKAPTGGGGHVSKKARMGQ